MASLNQTMESRMRRGVTGTWGKLVAIIALILLPFYLGSVFNAVGTVVPLDFFRSGENYMFRVLDLAGIYILLALGLNIVVGYAGLLDLGYVAFFGVGAYAYALLASPQLGIHIPFWFILPFAPLLAAMFGFLLGAPTLRLRGDYLAIVTLGFGEVVRILLNNLDRESFNLTNGPRGIIGIDPASLDRNVITPLNQENARLILYPDFLAGSGLTLSDPKQYYWLILVLVIGAVFLSLRLQESRIGRAWAAIREDEDVARAMGINTTRTKLLAFAMGASTSGFSGALFSSLQGFISPESFILMQSILILSMVVLGGMGNVPGVVLGVLVLYILPEVLRELQVYRMMIFGLLLTVMMLWRPEGIWPSQTRRRELHADAEEAAGARASDAAPHSGIAAAVAETQQGRSS